MSDLMDLYKQAALQDPRLQGNQPEMRSYSPSMGERVTGWLNALGAATGYYPDLGKRTNETLDLLGIASMVAPLGMPARAAAAGSGPAWDGAMARVLNRKYPDEKVVTGGQPGMAGEWFAADRYGDAYLDSSRGLSRQNELPRAGKMNATPGDPVRQAGNEAEGLSASDQAYLNELLAQQARAGFRTVR
jgi:hypothetical protein